MVKDRRKNTADRRQQTREIGVPFKDSNGATVRAERRLTPDRRVNEAHATTRADKYSEVG